MKTNERGIQKALDDDFQPTRFPTIKQALIKFKGWPGGEWVIIDSSASPQSSCNNGWLGHQIHACKVTHGL